MSITEHIQSDLPDMNRMIENEWDVWKAFVKRNNSKFESA